MIGQMTGYHIDTSNNDADISLRKILFGLRSFWWEADVGESGLILGGGAFTIYGECRGGPRI